MNDIKRKTILVVEDDAIPAAMVKYQLENENYKVIVASTGEDAIDLVCIRNISVDLILMDIDLGSGIDGTVTAQEILKYQEIPVLFHSSHMEKEIVDKTEKITSYGYVVKHSSFTVLDASIKMAFKLFDATLNERLKEKSLRESESRYRQLIGKISDIVYSYSTKRGGISWSPQVESILGYTGSDLINNPQIWHDSIHPDDRPVVDGLIKDFVDGKMFKIEYRIKDINGNWHWLLDQSIGKLVHEDEIIIEGTATDITGQKRIETALRDSEERFRHAMETSNDGLWDWDIATDKGYFSPAYFRMLGYETDQFETSGESWLDLIHPDDRERTLSANKDCIENRRESFEVEYRMKARDGSWKWIMGRGRAFSRDSSGRALRMIGTHADITARVLVETALRQSEQNYREIFNATNEAIFIHESLTGKITDVNRSMLETYGYNSKDEILSGTIGDLSANLTPYTVNEAKCYIDRAVSEGPQIFEWLAKKKCGEQFWAEVSLRSTQISGSGKILAVVRDITERKRSEDKINNLLLEKDIILKEVHHRVKNNMHTMTSLLNLQSDAHKNPETRSILADATGRLKSMMVLYNKLYRAENTSTVSLKDYLPALVNEIFTIFPEHKSVKIKTQIDDIILSGRILSPLGIIINEFITNAMKYAFTGRNDGSIIITARKEENNIVIIYEDNGTGLPESVSFVNSEGFGMQLIGMMVKQLKGSIIVDRKNGTRFTIKFKI